MYLNNRMLSICGYDSGIEKGRQEKGDI